MTDQSVLSELPEYLPPDEIKKVIERMRSTGWADMPVEHRAFVLAYSETYSHIKAAEKLNRSGSWGLKMIRDPLVLAMIQDVQDSYMELNILSENFIRQKWIELLPKLMGEEKVDIILANGAQMSGKKFFANESISVLRELGKSVENFYKGGDAVSDFANFLRSTLVEPDDEDET